MTFISMKPFSSTSNSVDSLIENALSGGTHSQITLAEYYATGYQVKQCYVSAFAWAFVASNNGSITGSSWQSKLWKEFKTEAEQRNALVQANELWVKILGTTKRG